MQQGFQCIFHSLHSDWQLVDSIAINLAIVSMLSDTTGGACYKPVMKVDIKSFTQKLKYQNLSNGSRDTAILKLEFGNLHM